MLSNKFRAWRALILSAGLIVTLPNLAISGEHGGAPERFVDGTLEIVHIDEIDQSQSRFVYFLLTAEGHGPDNSGAAFELRFQRTPPAGLKTGDRLNVRGRAVGRNLWVDDIATTGQQGSAEAPPETLAESTVDNPRSAVIVLVNITGTTTWSASHITTAEGVMYTNYLSVDGIYAEASFNQTGFPATHGTVVAPVTVDKIIDCPFYSYAAAADAAALSQQGVDVNGYQHRVYIIPHDDVADSDCDWLAVGVLGSYGSTGTLRSWSTIIDASALAHELGHNKGWHHAATDTNNNGFNPSEGKVTDDQYGDVSGSMGYCCTEKKFNAVHMDQIGWYDSQPVGTMLTAAADDTYTLVPLGSDPVATPGAQILKVSKPDTNEVYYLSYRQRIGRDANVPTSYTGGLNIHHASETGRWSYFIQTLADTQYFDDPVNGLTIQQNWHDASGVNITISYDSCLPANPTVSVAPAAQMVDSTLTPSANYNVTITNNDTAGCDPASFDLSNDIGGTLALSTGLVSPAASSSPAVLTVDTQMGDGDHGFVVTAIRGVDSGAGGGMLTVDTVSPTQPGTAAAVKKKVKGQQSIQVTWGASSDAGTGVAYYQVSRDSDGVIGTTSSLKFTDASADRSVAHDYTIEAVDGLDHVSPAALATFAPGGGGDSPGNSGGKGKKNK